MEYEWAVRLTRVYLDENGDPVGPEYFGIVAAGGERDARARLQEALRTIERGRHPVDRMLTGAVLLRRPLGAWEEVK